MQWRDVYNHERPYDALGLDTLAKHYQPSPGPYAQSLATTEYPSGDTVVRVKWNREVIFQGRKLKVSNALLKLLVAFRPDPLHDGCYDVFFCHHRFIRLDLREQN